MEPTLITAPALTAILEDLSRREPIFHRPAFGTTRGDYEAMTDECFWEVGASGRRYSRQHVLDTLEARIGTEDEPMETHGFHCLQIATDNYLITYTLLQGARMTRRATLWRRSPTGWKIVYHQGTLVEGQL